MQIAMIGLGRMGADMVHRLLGKGHERVVYARQTPAIASLKKGSAIGVATPTRHEFGGRIEKLGL